MVVDDAALVLDLQRMLHRGGYRAIGPTTTVPEIQRLIQRCDIDCAILDLDIDRRTPLPVADLLAFADLPFVYLATGGLGSVPPRHRHRPVVDSPLAREKLMAAVEKAIAGRRHVAHADRWGGAAVVPGTRVYPPL
jgi:hypothetical protein